MRFTGRFSGVARLLILGITVVFTAIVLVVGQQEEAEQVSLLQLSTGDECPHLLHQLPIDGHPGAGVYFKVERRTGHVSQQSGIA